MKREIGSEFWYAEVNEKEYKKQFNDVLFFMSGRTALDSVLKDILKNRTVKKAYLPSFCCDSMIFPFLKNNIHTEFYDVLIDAEGGMTCEINELYECDIVLIMNYFGFVDDSIYERISYMHKQGTVVIEDLTHSLFSVLPEKRNVDYVFASLRKWTMLYSGGFAYKMCGTFYKNPDTGKANQTFVGLRKKAAELKKRYFNGDTDGKNFLNLFSSAEQKLDTDYENYCIDSESLELLKKLDTKYICSRRRENGQRLLDGLKELNTVRTLFDGISDAETPMFIPISVKDNRREELKRFLISKNIYCPVHWPLTKLHTVSEPAKSIYRSVLSVVCDQRYGIEEMDYILKCVREFGG